MADLIDYDPSVERQVPPLIPERKFDSRYPSERRLERAYRTYALAHGQLCAVDHPQSHHASLDEDARRELFWKRLAVLRAAEAAYQAEERKCARNAARRATCRTVNRSAETAQRHMFVEAWPEEFQFVGSRFPHRPLVANKPKEQGSFRRPLHQAGEWLRLQYNPSVYVHLLVIDYDAPQGIDVREVWKLAGIARPTYIACNPDSPKGHIAYAITTPIPALEAGKSKALEYFHAIWVAYTKAVHGDLGFTQTLTKNPVHVLEAWEVEWLNPNPYTLKELASFVELPKNARRAKREARVLEDHDKVGLGRNCAIFYTVAEWSYRAIRTFWDGRLETWEAAVREQCDNLNATFPEPLPVNEVKTIANSISRWTWAKTTRAGFNEHQAKKGRVGGLRSGQTRLAKAQVYAEEVKALRASGMTQEAIADKLGISVRSVRDHLKRPPVDNSAPEVPATKPYQVSGV